MIRSFFLVLNIVISTSIALLLLLIFGLINPYSNTCKQIFYVWCQLILKISGIKIDCSGLDNFDSTRGYIVCSNHLHLFDIPILCVASKLNIKFAAKKELFKIPIFGQALHLIGMVRINRGNTKEALSSLKKAEDVIVNKHASLVIFPEGTRNRSGHGMLPFKKGAFMMALNTKQAILPASINGSNKILNGLRVKPRRVSIHFHPVIESTHYGIEKRKEFMTQTRKVIESKLE